MNLPWCLHYTCYFNIKDKWEVIEGCNKEEFETFETLSN